MRTSESIDQLAPALIKAQAAISSVTKDKVGKVQSKSGASYEYRYSDLAAVIAEVKPHLNINGLCFVQSPRSDSTGVFVETRILHLSGQWIETEVFIPVVMATPQAYGSAISYGKRYGLQAMTGLPSDDDDGQAASTAARPTAKQVLPGAMNGADVNREALNMMTEEEQDYLRSEAAEIKKLHAAGTNVYDYVEARHFDAEQKMALWALLPSDVRSAIKRGKPQAALASQA